MTGRRETMRRILCAAGLFGIAAALYLRTAAFGYIRLDDFGYTAGCPFVAGGLSWSAVREAFSRVTYGGIWMPLTYISYAADLTLFGAGWSGHHIVNALLHAVNAVLVFCFLLRFCGNGGRSGERGWSLPLCAFLAAAFWTVHPQRAEAVAWIASRKEELFAMFTLAGLMAWRSRRWFAGMACCALACMSKPTAVCFPLLAALVELHAWRGSGRLWGAAFRYAPLFLMAAVTGLAAIAAQTNPEGIGPVAVLHVPFLKRLLLALWALALGLAQTVFPYGIHFDYLMPCAFGAVRGADEGNVGAEGGRTSWKRVLAFAAAFYAIAYLPVSGILGSFGETFRADRFLYLPSVAVAYALCAALLRLGGTARSLFAAAVVAYAAAAWPVISSYRNDYTVFARTLELQPAHWRALSHVGAEYCARLGRLDEGIDLMRESYRISPRESTAETLAYSLACRGRLEDVPEIRRLVSRYVRLEGGDKRGMFAEALGIAEMLVGDWQGAETCLRASIAAPQRFYSDEEARLRLAETLRRRGDEDGATALVRPLVVSANRDIRQRAIKMLQQTR